MEREKGREKASVDASTPASGGSVLGEPCWTTDVGHSAELYHSNKPRFVVTKAKYFETLSFSLEIESIKRLKAYIYPEILKCVFRVFDVSKFQKWKDKFFRKSIFRKGRKFAELIERVKCHDLRGIRWIYKEKKKFSFVGIRLFFGTISRVPLEDRGSGSRESVKRRSR